jgi:hypothetical protein
MECTIPQDIKEMIAVIALSLAGEPSGMTDPPGSMKNGSPASRIP